jgi:hypothetical protein
MGDFKMKDYKVKNFEAYQAIPWEVLEFIQGADLDALAEMTAAVSHKRDELMISGREALQVGQMVRFDARRRGRKEGKIIKINRKTVKVDLGPKAIGPRIWNVAISLVEPGGAPPLGGW